MNHVKQNQISHERINNGKLIHKICDGKMLQDANNESRMGQDFKN